MPGVALKRAIDTLIEAYPDSPRSHEAMAENYFVLRQMPQAEKELQNAATAGHPRPAP